MDRYSKAGEEEKEIPLGHLNFLSPQINDMIFFSWGFFCLVFVCFLGYFMTIYIFGVSTLADIIRAYLDPHLGWSLVSWKGSIVLSALKAFHALLSYKFFQRA